jgi:hypothetical protein
MFPLNTNILFRIRGSKMISLNEFKNASNVSNVFSKLFHMRDTAHYAHLRTKSYAQHKALGSFYDDVLGLADQFIETYQGQYGLQKFEIQGVDSSDIDIVKYLEDSAKFILESHSALEKKDTHLHNIIDEIAGLLYQTLYKLKNLK